MKLHSLVAVTTASLVLLTASACFAGDSAPVKKQSVRTGPTPSVRVYNVNTGQFEEAPPYGPKRNSDRP